MADLALPWIVTAATVVFLSLCARHNRRTGYRKARNAESAVEDFLEWLHAVRALLPHSAHTAEKPLPKGASPQEQSEQLLNLNKALLEQSSSMVPQEETAPVPVQR